MIRKILCMIILFILLVPATGVISTNEIEGNGKNILDEKNSVNNSNELLGFSNGDYVDIELKVREKMSNDWKREVTVDENDILEFKIEVSSSFPYDLQLIDCDFPGNSNFQYIAGSTNQKTRLPDVLFIPFDTEAIFWTWFFTEENWNCKLTFEASALSAGTRKITAHIAALVDFEEFRPEDDEAVDSVSVTVENGCCFPAGTKITMADGSLQNIEDIKVGDKILSYDIENDEFTSWRVKMLGKPVHPVMTINDGLIQATVDHPFYVKKSDGCEGWAAYDPLDAESVITFDGEVLPLEIGDQLYSSDGEWIIIETIEYDSERIQTYNLLSFSGEKTYFANDMLVYEEHPPQIMTDYFLSLLSNKLPSLENNIRNSFWFDMVYKYLP